MIQNQSGFLKRRIDLILPLMRKPMVFIKWLYQSREMQLGLFLLAIFLFIPLYLPQLLEPVLADIYPPIQKKRIFGLVSGVSTNPDLEVARSSVKLSLWIFWSGLIVILLWVLLPRITFFADRKLREKEDAADRLVQQKPGDSIILYNEALQWALNPDTESSLINKIKAVNTQFSTTQQAPLKPVEQTVAIDPTATVVTPASAETRESTLIDGRYKILRRLGEGAMGIVYLAYDDRLGRDIAVKQLSPTLIGNEDLMARFRQEAKALARLIHPNIVQAYDFIESEHQAWISMEYIEGEGLDSILTDQPMALDQALDLTAQIANAMAYAHKRGVVHRDLKPANILVTPTGSVKIMDFGVAKLNESSMQTRVGTIMGSPVFMSPEQASGSEVDHSTDIYALGIILYRMLTGTFPFSGDAKSIIAQHLTKIPDNPADMRSDLPQELQTLISAMLSKAPEGRPESMDDIYASLQSLLENIPHQQTS